MSTKTISEIVRDDSRELEIPQASWDIEVVESGLEVNIGDIGGREEYVCNARVRVTEENGDQWTGLTRLGPSK